MLGLGERIPYLFLDQRHRLTDHDDEYAKRTIRYISQSRYLELKRLSIVMNGSLNIRPGRLVWVCDVCQEKCFSDYNDACVHEQTCLGPSPPIQLTDDADKVDDVDVNTSIISTDSNNNNSGSDGGDSSALTTSNDNNEFLPREVKQLLQRGHLHTKTCANCHQPGLLKCSRCKCQFYCSSDCQRANFDQHKKNCKAIG